MAKIQNDKYYTSPELAKYCVEKAKEIIGAENITEYLEPSAGGGVFLDFLDKPYLAYDIEPEDSRVVKQDFLTLDLPYKKGRCVIGNPPFGEKNILVGKFINKSKEIGEYICFILPCGNYKNNYKFKYLELIHSELLDSCELFSNIPVRCCFNIYKKTSKPNNKYKLDDVTIWNEQRYLNKKDNKSYDYRICCWGGGGRKRS